MHGFFVFTGELKKCAEQLILFSFTILDFIGIIFNYISLHRKNRFHFNLLQDKKQYQK